MGESGAIPRHYNIAVKFGGCEDRNSKKQEEVGGRDLVYRFIAATWRTGWR